MSRRQQPFSPAAHCLIVFHSINIASSDACMVCSNVCMLVLDLGQLEVTSEKHDASVVGKVSVSVMCKSFLQREVIVTSL